jgi:hypothetical protein
MELTWPIKLRIALASAVGIVLIGILCWPLVAPVEPSGVVSIVNGKISAADVLIIMALAFVSGLAGYFLSWPYGTRIGILAAPAGLMVWAARSGEMGALLQLNDPMARREEIYSTFCWEPLVWLAIVGAGCLGVLLAFGLCRPAKVDDSGQEQKAASSRAVTYLGPTAALIGSTLVAMFFIGILARDFVILDVKVGAAVAQPATAQIILAVLVAFGVAGFLVKKALELDYVWAIMSTCLVTPFAIITYGRYEVLKYFAERWPAVFFSNSVLAVFPIQMVAFGTLGAVAGYWLAVRYNYWRRHEAGGE